MKTLFEKQGVVTPEDDKTNIYFEFDVPSGIDKIIIDYSYSPKTVENRADAVSLISAGLEKYLGTDNRENPIDYLPVKNLITLSLDENGKYRGAAHRQDDVQHHEISADFASNGFFKGKIEAYETDDDFGEETVDFARMIPYNDSFVKFIFGSIDFNAYAYAPYTPEN